MMKKLVLKHSAGIIFFFSLICALYFLGGYLFFRSLMHSHFSPDKNPKTMLLVQSVLEKSDPSSVNSAIEDFYNSTGIMAGINFSHNGRSYYEDAWKMRKYTLKLHGLVYPLPSRGGEANLLTVWPDAGYIFSGPARQKTYLFLGIWLAGLALWAFLGIYSYIRASFISPLRELRQFLENIENERFESFDASAYPSEWRQIALRLNTINNKLSGTTETLQMLLSVSKALTSHLEVNDIFNVVLEIIIKKFNTVSSSVIMYGENGFLSTKNYRGLSPEWAKSVRVRPGDGLLGHAYQRCESVVVNDFAKPGLGVSAADYAKEGIGSFVYIPIVVDSKCMGILNVNSKDTNFFTHEKVEAIKTLAEYLSIAVRNVGLYERVGELNRRLETEVSSTTMELIQTNSRLIQKVREMKALSDIAGYAAAKSGLSELLEMIVDKTKELLSAQAAGIFLYSPETNEVIPSPPFFGIKDREFSRLRFSLNEARVLGSAIKDAKHFVFNDEKSSREALPLLANLLAIHSLAIVPLRSGNKPVGVMGVANKFGAPFTQDDLRILELIADRIAGIIENVTLYQELEHRLRDLTALQEISSAISSEPELDKTMNKVVSTTTKAFASDLCALLLFNEMTGELETQSGAYFTGDGASVMLKIPVDDPNSLSAQVFRSGEPFLSPDASLDPRIKSQTARLWDLRSIIIVPLMAENKVIGVLRIGRHQANSYNKDHLRLATLISHQAAVIIANAHLYDSLRDAKIEQERLNQVKNEFLSIVSHELRTPITTIKGFVKVVLQGEAGPLNSQQEKFLQIADQSTDRLTVLISDLLDISRIESGKLTVRMEQVDPKALIEEVVRNIAGEAQKKGLTLKAELPAILPLINADRDRLRQVFDNLILNSIKFTPSGGRIDVAAVDKGDYLMFSVKDSGIGISSRDQQRIFEKFYQAETGTTRSTAGAGLGLAIVKSIIEFHGGQIWVESEPGMGSTFTFLIPRAKPGMRDFSEKPAAGPGEAAKA